MIYVIIKGKPEQAMDAAEAHGMNLVAITFDARFGQTAGRVLNSDHIALIHWMCEVHEVPKGKEWPVGTLLWHGAPQD